MATALRQPAVAGRFYPANAQRLRAEIETYTTARANASTESEPKIHALGCIVPHAGYVYSGHVAGAVYRRLELPQRLVILCPNHTGMGEPLAIMSEGAWHTPLGDAVIDKGLADELKARMPLLAEDQEAHRYEHALEVQLHSTGTCSGISVRAHHCGNQQFRGVERPRGRDWKHRHRSSRTRTGHRVERYESLRERRRDPGKRSPRD